MDNPAAAPGLRTASPGPAAVRTGDRPATPDVKPERDRAATWARFVPPVWAALTIVTTVTAAVLAGALRYWTIAALLCTALTRSAADVAGVACVGLALVGALVEATRSADTREADRLRDAIDRLLVAVGGTWLVLALLGVAVGAANAYGRAPTTLTGPDILAWATSLSAGRGALLTVGCAAAVLACSVMRLNGPDAVSLRIVVVIALLGLITPSVSGHASTAASHEVAVTTVALHVAAASLWVGGLAAILALLGRRRALLDAVLPRFSTLAGFCIVLLTLSGVVSAWVRIGSWSSLFSTGYGVLVILKSVAVVVLGGLGLLTRRRMAAGRVPVLRWAGVEVALMAVTLGIAAALSQTAG